MHVQLTALLAGGGNIIDLDGTLFVQVALFFLLFFVLRPLLFRPVMDTFDARDRAIVGAKQEAEVVRKEAAGLADTFQAELAKVRASAGAERERLQAEGTRLEQQLLEQARAEVRATLQAADVRIAAELGTARAELDRSVPELAARMASKVLGREVRR